MEYEVNHLDNRTCNIINGLLQDNYIDDILCEDLRYCLEHRLSLKERQVIEHLVEGYTDQEIYTLLKKVFPTYHAYEHSKSKAKKKLLQYMGL